MKNYADILALDLCEYPKLEKYWSGTALDILHIPDYREDDKFRIVLRPEWIDTEMCLKFATILAKELLKICERPHSRCQDVIGIAEIKLHKHISDDPYNMPPTNCQSAIEVNHDLIQTVARSEGCNMNGARFSSQLAYSCAALSWFMQTLDGGHILTIINDYNWVISKAEKKTYSALEILIRLLDGKEYYGMIKSGQHCTCITTYDLTYHHKPH